MVDKRVLVDWDGDNVIKTDLKTDTPLNLMPAPRGQSITGLRGIPVDGTILDPAYEDIIDEDDNGLAKRRITISTADAKYAEALMLDWLKGQTRPDDVVNIASDGSKMDYLKKGDSSSAGVLRVAMYQPDDLENGYAAIQLRGRILQNFSLTPPANLTLGSTTAALTTTAGVTTFTDPAISTPTFILTPSTTYKLGIWTRIKAVQVRNAQSRNIVARIWYANGTTNPTVITGTVDVNSLNNDGDWHLLTWHFTTPAVVTHYGFNFSISNNVSDTNVYDWDIAGLTIYPNSAVAADFDRFRDDSNLFRAEQFSVVLAADTAYRGSFYVRQEAVTTTLLVSLWDCELETTSITNILDQDSNTISSSWSRIEFSIPSRSYERGLLLRLEIPSVSATVNQIDFKGFMIWEGTTPNVPFNYGIVNGYDDITSYVLSVDWKSGKKGFLSSVPFDGTLSVVLNNDSEIFSPKNTASPLYGQMKQGRLVKLQTRKDITDTWFTLWTGQTQSFEITAGRTSDRTIELNASQGVNNLKRNDGLIDPVENSRIGTAIETLIEESSWRTGSAFQAFLDSGYRTDDNAFVKDTEVFDSLDEGVNILEFIGQDWDRNTSVLTAVEDLLDSELGQIWVTREGHMVFAQRDYWAVKAYDPIEVLTLDTEVQAADYVYGEDIINVAEVKIQPKVSTTANSVLWETKRPVRVDKRSKRDLQVEFDVGEGLRPLTVADVANEDMDFTVYVRDPFKYGAVAANEATDYQAKYATVQLVKDGAGRYTVKLQNRNAITYWIAVTINGKFKEVGDELTATSIDADAVEASFGVYKHALNTKILDSFDQAKGSANTFILRNAEPDGEFTSLRLILETDADYTRLQDYQIGEVLDITETQTGETNRLHIITGINGSMDGTLITVNYDLARIESQLYAVTGESILGSEELNLIDHRDIIPTNGGIIEDVTILEETTIKALKFGIGSATFFFGLDAKMVEKLKWDDRICLWPENSAASASLGAYSSITNNVAYNNNADKLVVIGWTDVSTGYFGRIWGGKAANPDYSGTSLVLAPTLWPKMRIAPGVKYRAYTTYVDTSVMLKFGTPFVNTSDATRGGNLDTWNDSLGSSSHDLSDEFDKWFNITASSSNSKNPNKHYGTALVTAMGVNTPGLGFLDLVRFDARWGIYIEPGEDHYFTLWASVGSGMHDSVDYIVDVYGDDGLTKVTDTITLTDVVQKFELLIPDTEEVVFANIRRSSTDADSYQGDVIWLFGYAVTKGHAPDDYTAVNVPGTEAALIYA